MLSLIHNCVVTTRYKYKTATTIEGDRATSMSIAAVTYTGRSLVGKTIYINTSKVSKF